MWWGRMYSTALERMPLIVLALPSGLAGFASDVREFLAALRFAHSSALWLLLLLPILGLMNRWSARKRRNAVAQVGRPAAIAGQLTNSLPRRRWLGLAYPLGWIFLILGLAGPQWGKSDDSGVAVGRDIVIVIDLSRSMRADDVNLPQGGWHTDDAKEKYQPKRWLAARESALDLLDGIQRRGGHRVAVVVFASHSKVICPLTTDYDHVRFALEEIDGQHPPPECRPGIAEVISGTRIGAGLIEAVNLQDKRFPGYQDIFLLSDGDDPADDKEWLQGSIKAREKNIPIYTVGFGNPDKAREIDVGDPQIKGPETQLQEQPLMQIANETRGEYIPARMNSPQLGDFFRTRLEPLPGREVSDDSIPLPRERYPWFLAPALGFFLIGYIRGR
jgi:Ca-activated chloride channel family protein